MKPRICRDFWRLWRSFPKFWRSSSAMAAVRTKPSKSRAKWARSLLKARAVAGRRGIWALPSRKAKFCGFCTPTRCRARNVGAKSRARLRTALWAAISACASRRAGFGRVCSSESRVFNAVAAPIMATAGFSSAGKRGTVSADFGRGRFSKIWISRGVWRLYRGVKNGKLRVWRGDLALRLGVLAPNRGGCCFGGWLCKSASIWAFRRTFWRVYMDETLKKR